MNDLLKTVEGVSADVVALRNFSRSLGPDDSLESYGIMRDGKLTLLGAVCFALDPHKLSPGYSVEAVRRSKRKVSGTRRITGPLPSLLMDGVDYVLSQTSSYPADLLKEVLVNALAHRDYSSPYPVTIILSPDYLEISNPLGISPGPVLHPVLKAMGLMEARGRGIPRMYALCRMHGLHEPELHEMAGEYRVILRPAKKESALFSWGIPMDKTWRSPVLRLREALPRPGTEDLSCR